MIISRMEDLEGPDPRLEQYLTPYNITVDILIKGLENGDIEGKKVAELGCGGAPFGIGSWILGALGILCVDVDPRCIQLATGNLERAGADPRVGTPPGHVEFEQMDISDPMSDLPLVDTVFMNPPFGSQNRRADRPFIHRAMKMADIIYSLHNGVTRPFLLKEIERMGGKVLDEETYRMEIPHRYHFHTKERLLIDVILLRYRGGDSGV